MLSAYNRRMLTRRNLAVLLLIIAAPLLLAGCGDSKVSGTTKDGTKLASSGDSLPKGWPKGLAAPKGATVTSVISEGNVATVSGTSSKDPIALAAQFADSMKADGWTQTNRSSDENSIVVEEWEQGKVRAQVSTIEASDGATFTLIHNPG